MFTAHFTAHAGTVGLSGPHLAQHIVQRRPAIQVLLVSGYASRAGIDLGLSSHKAGSLQKPFGLETLARKVRERLNTGRRGPQ